MPTTSKSLSPRQRNLLFALIKEYCDNNESIGSKELAQKYGFDFSPATIRNELAALRVMGYLYQPFTNSSSQPTEKAFKLFINRLIDGIQVSSHQQTKLTDKIRELQHKQTEMNREIAKLLADQVGGVGFSLSQNNESVKGISNLLKHGGDGKISDILSFLDNLDQYKQFLLPGATAVMNATEGEVTAKLHHSSVMKMIVGDENPVVPLGRGYAMVSTEVILENGEKSVVGVITPIQLLAKKKNLQLLEAINKAFGVTALEEKKRKK